MPLKEGIFLVATPNLTDPNFIHAVILLITYGKEGTSGLIINRPSGIHIKQIFPDIKPDIKNDLKNDTKNIREASSSVYIGGPVNRGNLFILFTSDKPQEGALRVFDDIYFTGNEKVIVPLLKDGNSAKKVRAYSGYAGWASGQLEHEIMRGAWITMEADSSVVFSEDTYSIWPSIFKIPEDIMARSTILY